MYSASPAAGGDPKAFWSGPFGLATPFATPTSFTAPPRLTAYAIGRAGGMVKSSVVWKMIASSLAVRTVPTSVAPAGIETGSGEGAERRKRRWVVAATGGSSSIPSRLSSVTCSFSGTRLSR